MSSPIAASQPIELNDNLYARQYSDVEHKRYTTDYFNIQPSSTKLNQPYQEIEHPAYVDFFNVRPEIHTIEYNNKKTEQGIIFSKQTEPFIVGLGITLLILFLMK